MCSIPKNVPCTLILRLQATKLITATPDEASPLILVWDLRNSNAPEKVGLWFPLDLTYANKGTDFDRS